MSSNENMKVRLEITKEGHLPKLQVLGVEGYAAPKGEDIPVLKDGYYSLEEVFSGSWRILKSGPNSTCYFVIDNGAGGVLVIPYPC